MVPRLAPRGGDKREYFRHWQVNLYEMLNLVKKTFLSTVEFFIKKFSG
jgi:hypothetical protein